MATQIAFRNPVSGEVRRVKIGWSWTLFLFGTILGIPLWMRKVYPAAATMVVWDILCLVLPQDSGTDIVLKVAGIGLAVVLGMRGNRETAKYYLKHGWEWVDPEGEGSRFAMEKWALA